MGGGCYLSSTWAVDSTLITSLGNVPNTIFISESGFKSYPELTNPPTPIVTTKGCPMNFKPYVQMVPSKVFTPPPSAQQEVLIAIGVCIQSVVPPNAAPNYTINYLATRNFSKVTTIGRSGGNLYASTKADSFLIGEGYLLPNPGGGALVSGLQYTDNNTSTGGIYWTLYCYPPGQTPPPNTGAGQGCAQGLAPFFPY